MASCSVAMAMQCSSSMTNIPQQQTETTSDDHLHEVYLALGSNLGNRQEMLDEAVRQIGCRIGKVIRRSSWIETEPWGFESSNRFLNGAVCCYTSHTPHEVLLLTQAIERDMGRKRKTDSHHGYSDRTIDIDILLYDDLRIDSAELVIPHPLMEERDFVMIPLHEILRKVL